MSGLVALAINCNSPISHAYELLRLPTFPSRLGLNLVLCSSGIPTGLAQSIPSFCKMDSRYQHCEIVTEQSPRAISIPTIFTGSPRSVSSHSASRLVFVLSINSFVVANSNRSLTQTVTMMKSSPSRKI